MLEHGAVLAAMENFTYYFTSISLSEFDRLVEALNVMFSRIDELARSYAIDDYPTRSGHLDEYMVLILMGSLLLIALPFTLYRFRLHLRASRISRAPTSAI
jgi:hypothetical protein